VTESVDRLSRDVGDADRFRKLLTHHTVDLECLDGTRITASGKSDALMFGMRSLFAEQYRIDLADKTLRGLEGNARKGAPTGGVPYGYRIKVTPSADPKRPMRAIEIHPDQAAVVRRIFSMYLAGHSFASIAAKLNAEGLPTPRARPGREGLGWAHSAVRSMLLNASYIGRFTYGARKWVKVPGTNTRRPRARSTGALNVRDAPELAIIDRETFERVGEMFTRRKATEPTAHRARILSGVLRCAACGSRMHTVGRAGFRYYMCSAAKSGQKCTSRKAIVAEVADDLVVDHIRQRLEASVDEVLSILDEEIRAWAAGRTEQSDALRKGIDRRAKQIATAVAALLESPSAAVRDRLRTLEGEQAAAVQELATFAADAPKLPTARQLYERIRELTDVHSVPTEVARERIRSLSGDGSIFCAPEADGSFRLKWHLQPGALFEAENENPAASAGEGAKGGIVVSTRLVAGAGFEPTTFGL
jgi:site-specific DNA recombinase